MSRLLGLIVKVVGEDRLDDWLDVNLEGYVRIVVSSLFNFSVTALAAVMGWGLGKFVRIPTFKGVTIAQLLPLFAGFGLLLLGVIVIVFLYWRAFKKMPGKDVWRTKIPRWQTLLTNLALLIGFLVGMYA